MTLTHNNFIRRFYQKQGAANAGTWSWHADALQTNFASLTNEGAGTYYNDPLAADLDEYKWLNIFLTKGTYKITIISVKDEADGIIEMLHGTTSLGTQDMYAAVTTYNQTVTFTFTHSYDITADMRFRVNGKNDSATSYRAEFSRILLEKTE